MRARSKRETAVTTMDRSALVPERTVADKKGVMPNRPEHSDDRAPAHDRFARRAQSIAALVARRLEATRSAHDLSERRLWAAHRDLIELHREGGAPTPTDYWEQSAHPRARHFLNEMMQVIAAEQEELLRAFQQFAVGIAERPGLAAPAREDDSAGHRCFPGQVDDTLAAAIAVAHAGVDEFITAASVGNKINEVGAWWQGKLRRKAILATAGKLLITPLGRYEIEVAAAEMRLLAEPPWSHDDRLLSAFELAHSDLRDHVATLRKDLHRRTRAMLTEAYGNDGRRPSRSGRRDQPHPDQAPIVDAIELR